jgi:hypothetical protein
MQSAKGKEQNYNSKFKIGEIGTKAIPSFTFPFAFLIFDFPLPQ